MKKSHNIAQRCIPQRCARPALALFLLTGSAFGGEYAVLTNGFRLRAERHDLMGERVRLYANGGFSELAAADISSYEPEEYTAHPAPVLVPTLIPAPVPLPLKTDMYSETAKRHGLPPALVRSIVKAESNGRADAISPKGAIGLMQLMPGTARDLGADPAIPEQNVDAGTRYLRDLLARYEDKDDQVARAVAAYNAGPGAVDKYNGVPPYRETQNYVRRVLKNYDKLK
ncbi:MAG: lytic transglycosylase domain-containing protein [Acidobacteriota bacterium]|nr:lytic transglycosylase domain-containing protein [Acidobacteriota bacterium]